MNSSDRARVWGRGASLVALACMLGACNADATGSPQTSRYIVRHYGNGAPAQRPDGKPSGPAAGTDSGTPRPDGDAAPANGADAAVPDGAAPLDAASGVGVAEAGVEQDARAPEPQSDSAAPPQVVDASCKRCDAGELSSDAAVDDASTTDAGPAPCPRNVILMVADGSGAEQIRATRMFQNGDTAPLFLETLPVSGEVITVNIDGLVTDSAAAASAMATGRKYPNGAISELNGVAIETALELCKAAGKSTGLVTIHTSALDATPAAFGAHEETRGNITEIALDYANDSRPNIVMGSADGADIVSAFQDAGYVVATTAEELAATDPAAEYVIGQLPNGAPTLPERAVFALERLARDPDGFFLLLESEGTDNAGHSSDLGALVTALGEFNDAVETVVTWAEARPAADTLVVVVSDHETGGLDVTETEPVAGMLPRHAYTSGGSHTTRSVPIFVYGGELPRRRIDNTKVFSLLGCGPAFGG